MTSSMRVNLVLCHVGDTFPEYIYQCIHQALLWNEKDVAVYVLTNESFIQRMHAELDALDVDAAKVTVVPVEVLPQEDIRAFETSTKWSDSSKQFRGAFWLYTSSRFAYIYSFMKHFRVDNVFHIENDVMLYTDLNAVVKRLREAGMADKICVPQDAPQRAICSMVYIPDTSAARDYLDHCTAANAAAAQPLNDMTLMGLYRNKHALPDSPDSPLAKTLGIFDACAFGQYLGGVDPRNIPGHDPRAFDNPTVGFVNETAVFKANTVEYVHVKGANKAQKLLKLGVKHKHSDEPYELNALHIHSKQLQMFSSTFDVRFNDIITGDRVLTLCDFVFLTKSILQFHKGIERYNRNVFMVKDFADVNIAAINETLLHYSKQCNKKTVKLFVYTHILEQFAKSVFPRLTTELSYQLYAHNSDGEFGAAFASLLESPQLEKVYAQNLNVVHKKARLLPIGIANQQWPHGDLNTLYGTMLKTVHRRKRKNLYVNINQNTYAYRRVVVNALAQSTKSWTVTQPDRSYEAYLAELAEHHFSLCVRGNGIDTHRFWESLYLGVIPVIVSNTSTRCSQFVALLEQQKIPHFQVRDISVFQKVDDTFFDKTLYENIVKRYSGWPVQIHPALKLSSYK